jgi:hypothetical protein
MDFQTIVPAASPEVPANENFETINYASVYGKRHPVTTALTWGYYGGRWGGAAISAGTLTLTDANTNYVVVLRSSGAISVSTSATNWNDTASYARVYKLTTAGGVVTAVEDHRAGTYGIASGATGVTELRGLIFTSDTDSTADTDPGNGLFKWNNATQASATVLYLDNQTADGVSLTTLWASLAAQGLLYLQQSDDPSKWQLWKWTAFPVDGTGYRKFTVALQASGGSIADAKTTYAQFDNLPGTVGKHMIPIMASGMMPSVSGGCAALATFASAANKPDITTLDFDTTIEEYAQFSVPMPKSWNEGTVTFKPIWSHAATTTNFGVVFDLQGIALSNDDAIAQAFGTAQTSTDTGGTTNDLYVGPESSAITIAGTPAAEDVVFFRLSRVTGDGGDTMAIDARLHGIVLYITTDAENDA